MLVVGHDHGNMAVGSIVLSVVPIGKLIGTRKSEFAGSPPLARLCALAECVALLLTCCILLCSRVCQLILRFTAR